MDRLSKERRSWNMSRIRSGDTQPERVVRSILHRLGYRFRTTTGNALPGKPDIVLPRYRTAIFVHGCFWHRHSGCRFAYTPKTRVAFWRRKFNSNVARDKRVQSVLRQDGWRVLTVWECEVDDSGRLPQRLSRLLARRRRPRATATER